MGTMFQLFVRSVECIIVTEQIKSHLLDTIDTKGVAMRDYILHEAQNRAAHGLLGALKRKLELWRARKDLKTLLRFSDYHLRDIGLTRADLRDLLSRPSDCDLMWELERQHKEADATNLRDLASAHQEADKAQPQTFRKPAPGRC